VYCSIVVVVVLPALSQEKKGVTSFLDREGEERARTSYSKRTNMEVR
jgi:hypothetical protein